MILKSGVCVNVAEHWIVGVDKLPQSLKQYSHCLWCLLLCSSNQKMGILCFGRQNEVSLTNSVCNKNEPLITAYDGQKQTRLSTLTSNSIYNNSQSILSNCSTISVSNPNPNLYRRSYIYPTLNNLVTDFAIDGIQCSCGCLDSLHGELMQAAGTLERDKWELQWGTWNITH